MSDNPFKIIGIHEEPPEDLRKEVLGNVRLAMLAMRISQLFVADYAASLFENLKLIHDPQAPTDPKDPDPQ